MADKYIYSYSYEYYEYFASYDAYLIANNYNLEKSQRIQVKIKNIIENNLIIYPDMYECAKYGLLTRRFIVEDHIVYYAVNHKKKEILIMSVRQKRQQRIY